VIFFEHPKAGALSKNIVPCDVIISLAANYFLWYFSIYGRVGLLCNQTKDSLNFRGVKTEFILSLEKRKGMSKRLGLTQHLFSKP
jgi:hypothetical protein